MKCIKFKTKLNDSIQNVHSTANKNMTSEEKETTPKFEVHRVVHCQQRYTWDCGISCVLMLVSADHRQEILENLDQICQEEGFGHSTWTIDLCYLLKRYNIENCMYTTRIGVNEEHRKHGYYSRIIDLDAERVRRRFARAEREGVRVVQRALSDRELLQHVAGAGPALVLVDAGLLACRLCKHNKLQADFRSVFGGAYRGHYVLLVGTARGRWAYRDPALRARLCVASPPRVRAARAAAGTDQDVILVYNHYR